MPTLSAEDLVALLTQAATSPQPAFRLGSIATLVGATATLLFDGEPAAGTAPYHPLASYTPVVNDRVLVALVGKGGVILGRIV